MKTRKQNPLTNGQWLLAVCFVLGFPILLLLLSGDGRWVEGWIFIIWHISLTLSCLRYLYRYDPELLVERFRKPGKSPKKRRQPSRYALPILFWTWIVIIPLDAKRLGWSPDFPLWMQSLGGLALVPAFFFCYRSFTDNTFLSPLVRIQSERKQHVISTGVYRFVRHPMYLSAICLLLGTPILLGSVLGILLGVIGSLVLVGRIIGEEKMLLKELEGYHAYTQKVRYKLIPFIW
jgi:protein-S-isoprenylcysteine O-methyltransferase Ste14